MGRRWLSGWIGPLCVIRSQVWLPSQNGGGQTATKRHTPEGVVAKLRQADVSIAQSIGSGSVPCW
ncbi:hypothetical protein MPAR168_19210 [Methylorubrum populi]|uniref:Uncharacterized protein n=1 Tax=Methylobacterium radiotolerans TaxID=31998 RepID=A0ABU7T616_9HYPH